MGGVPNEKDAAHLISLRLTAVDTVVDPPDGITQHSTRGAGIEYRLEVLQDICRHEIGGIIVTRERDTKRVTNANVGAVAGDEIVGVGCLLFAVGTLERCAHALFVLLERNEFNTPFHLCAETRQISGHYMLRLALWQ